MVKAKTRGRPPKYSVKAGNEEENDSTDKKPVFGDSISKDSISAMPSLDMRIFHIGPTHIPQTNDDKVVYKYKEPNGTPTVLSSERINELASAEEENEDICYEDKDKTVSVKKSLIDDYRSKSNYWGPLRIIAENVKVKENGALKDAIQAKLQHVEIQATDNEGKTVNDHELKILMSQTPGIIPATDPPNLGESEEGFHILNLGEGEKYKVSKKAMSAFKKLSGVEAPFNTKIQKVFTTTEGKVTPVTIVTLYPRVNKLLYQSELVNDKNSSLKKIISKKEKAAPKLVNYYRQNYINWAHRGNVCFSEIKKTGVDFFEEILVANPIVSEPLHGLGTSLASTATNVEDTDVITDDFEESDHPVGSKEFVDEMWQYLCGLVRSDSFLIEFEFEMDDEKWLEIKRAFNMFQLDGEVLPDIVLKMVSKKKDNDYTLTFYLRCIGRLIKHGEIVSKSEINHVLKCLSKDKYICVGLPKDCFLYQADQNEMLRQHLKESAQISMLPFEGIHDKKCKAIVRETDNIENSKFKRKSVSVYGPSIICKPCDALLERLKELQDPSLNPKIPQEISQRFVKQRYGPVHSINVSQNIKNLFTQSPIEFVAASKRKHAIASTREDGESLPKLLKTMDSSIDIPDAEKPSIKVSEDDFEKMITIKKNSKSTTLKKSCDECGFQAKSLLSLFLHMTDHLGPLVENCKSCTMIVSSKQALVNHVKMCHSKRSARCTECSKIFMSGEKLFEHVDLHRKSKPYSCTQCTSRLQTLNDYKKHLKINHKVDCIKDLNFHCRMCNSYFYTPDHLLIHKLNQNHSEKEHLKCRICNFSCSVASAYLTHILNHSADQREAHNIAACAECKKVFFSTLKLNDHMQKKHSFQVKEKDPTPAPTPPVSNESAASNYEGFSCNKCYKILPSAVALQRHNETSHPEKTTPISSHEPPSIAASAAAAITAATSASMSSQLSCNMCGRKFTSEHFLNIHMKLHTATRPVFQCEECGYVYAKRTQVLEHIRNDHAEQVEKHQQMQQQHHQNIIPDNSTPPNPIYGGQQSVAAAAATYPGGQIVGLHNQAHMVQSAQAAAAAAAAGWNQLKIPTVDQPQDVPYNFTNFNSQFF